MKSLRLYSRLFICSCLAMSPLLVSEVSYAQDSSKDQQQRALEAYMTPSRGEGAGQISRGELLPVALKKRENLNPDSVNKAIKSIGTIFDFRNSRTGDKYLYQADGNRKILLLRYQRMNQVYEAILDPATGSYEAKFVDPATLVAPKQVPFEQAPVVAEDEVDVESVAMGQQLQAAQPVQPEMADGTQESVVEPPQAVEGQQMPQAAVAEAPAVAKAPAAVPSEAPGAEMPSQAAAVLDAMDMAHADDPVQPVDEALAGKPSPDAEFPENPGAGEHLQAREDQAPVAPDADLPEMTDEDAAEPQVMPLPTVAAEPKGVAQDERAAHKITPVPSSAIRAKRQADSDAKAAFGTLSIVMFISGLVMLLLGLACCVVPSIWARRKCAKLGLRVHGMIRVSSQQRIACVEHDEQKFLIGIEQDKMTLLAPAPMNFDHFWRQISAKTYWHQMANKRLSGDEFMKILHDFVPYQPATSEADMEATSSIVEMHEFRDDLYHADISDYASVEDIEDKILFDVNVLSAQPEDDAQDLAEIDKHTAITAVNHVALLDVSDEEEAPYRAITAVNHVSLLDESDEENAPYRAITAVNHVALLDAPEAEEPHTAITAVMHAPLLDDDEVQEIYADDAVHVAVYPEDDDAASVYPEDTDDASLDGVGEFTSFELIDSDSDESHEEMLVVSDADADSEDADSEDADSDDEDSDEEESDDEDSDDEDSDDEDSDDEDSDDEDSDDGDSDNEDSDDEDSDDEDSDDEDSDDEDSDDEDSDDEDSDDEESDDEESTDADSEAKDDDK